MREKEKMADNDFTDFLYSPPKNSVSKIRSIDWYIPFSVLLLLNFFKKELKIKTNSNIDNTYIDKQWGNLLKVLLIIVDELQRTD